MRFVVTTSHKPTREEVVNARTLAEELGVKYVSRGRLREFEKESPVDFYYVFDKNGQLSIKAGESVFFFHPGMSKVRYKNIKLQNSDYLINSMELHGEEIVLDTTFGLGNEALLIAHFLPRGKVVGLEASEHIFRVVSHGLRNYPYTDEWIREASTRIELHNIDLREFVKSCADNSYDIVYCDPMFDRPQLSSHSINPLRPFAVYERIIRSDVDEMIRVASKRFIIKSRTRDTLFEELGLHFDRLWGSKKSGVLYGVIEKK
ncbi:MULTISPECIES: class I SAM-dependent methyltransferase [Mesotoga]|jgi:hypothetical protein|uniref:class I SAM-dependent methyltransferase n=1 Tax=Mesotoga TaxID=1184396 RepID=UPI0002CAF7F2|nr:MULTISPECIES: class I SAM-dependent methyltransferase [Mesotoga]MCP5456828.1 class I SAM-dependent methyltransferase [Thermotogota bacterium]CCU86074.1 conserved hypothetical protein [Mesotoga infera]MCB1223262.1 class I SAM-dependent methyltransferase [Mesotoga sp.]MCP5461005.1 class I SAM-dependent methyltransferase [Thermotogota bacterium]MDK2943618.1 hypothetical protein [Mesotoga sp.]